MFRSIFETPFLTFCFVGSAGKLRCREYYDVQLHGGGKGGVVVRRKRRLKRIREIMWKFLEIVKERAGKTDPRKERGSAGHGRGWSDISGIGDGLMFKERTSILLSS